MALGTAYPFGLRDVKITPFVSSSLETLGTAVDLPAARTLNFTESEDFVELRGDDSVITRRGTGATVEFELEGGGYSADVAKILLGATLTDSGTTPNQKRLLRKLATDARAFFRVEGQAYSDNGGDVHALLYRCRLTGDIEMNYVDGEFFLTNASGTAFPSQGASTLGYLYDITYNETVTPIT